MEDKKVKKNKDLKNNKIDEVVVVVAYFFILFLAWFDFYNLKSGNEIGFTLLYFYILLPVITLIFSIYVGKEKRIGNIKWLFIIAFGILYMSPLFTLSLKGESIIEICKSYYDMFFNGTIISFIGILIGTVMSKRKKQKQIA